MHYGLFSEYSFDACLKILSLAFPQLLSSCLLVLWNSQAMAPLLLETSEQTTTCSLFGDPGATLGPLPWSGGKILCEFLVVICLAISGLLQSNWRNFGSVFGGHLIFMNTYHKNKRDFSHTPWEWEGNYDYF